MNNRSDLFHDLRKYLVYYFGKDGFRTDQQPRPASAAAINGAKTSRGIDRPPAIFIQGVMPRAGTVYVGELLKLHPDIYAYPHNLWEFPALPLTADLRKLQDIFLQNYRLNRGKIGDEDFVTLFGAALMSYLYSPVPAHQRVLIKMPSVQFLIDFFTMFPFENLLVLLRDGRDVVHSTLKTWPHLTFTQVCLRWNRSARMVLASVDYFKGQERSGFWVGRYEDALENPAGFVQKACCRLNLNEDVFPYEKIDTIRVIGSSKLENKDKVTWRHLQKPKDFRPVEYWKEWSTVKKWIFKRIAGRSLIDLGYAADQDW